MISQIMLIVLLVNVAVISAFPSPNSTNCTSTGSATPFNPYSLFNMFTPRQNSNNGGFFNQFMNPFNPYNRIMYGLFDIEPFFDFGFSTCALTKVATSISFVTLRFLGLVAYSYYTVQGCDPFKAGYLKNRNQFSFLAWPKEIFTLLKDEESRIIGWSCSVSSVINGLAANTIEDLLRPAFDRYNTTEKGKIFIAKISVFFFGGLCVSLSFVARTLPGTVVQATIGFVGACAGPVFGIFLLGASTPWGNIAGAASGLVVSLVLNAWITLGGIMYGRRPVPLPPALGNSCHVQEVANITGLYLPDPFNNSTGHQDIRTSSPIPVAGIDSGGNPLYNISYMNYALTGWLIAFLLGFNLAVSLATKHWHEPTRDERLLLPFVRRFWKLNQADELQQTVKLRNPWEHSVEGPQTQKQLISLGNPTSDMI